MIDQRFSRQSFESLRAAAERQLLARELAEEVRRHVEQAQDVDNAWSAVLSRLRLIGHHLYPVEQDGDRTVYAGDPEADSPPTGLELEVVGGAVVEARFRARDASMRRR